jgi:hypothetical protein
MRQDMLDILELSGADGSLTGATSEQLSDGDGSSGRRYVRS